MFGRQRTRLFALFQDVVGQQDANLISVEGVPFQGGIRGFGSRHAQAVAIGIGCQDQFRAGLLSTFDDPIEDGGVLGIGNVIRNIGKVPVRLGVLRKGLDILKAVRR